MARRRAFLHIGPTHTGSDFLQDALAANAAGLAAYGVRCPARPGEEMFRAAVEIRRVHKAWGYRRREVEGTWSAICRRARKGRDTIVLSQPHLAAATPDEIALLLDRLDGFDVHIVVTAPRSGADHDLACVVQRWSMALRGPERMHVIGPAGDAAEAFLWAELGRLVGFDTAELPLPDGDRRGDRRPHRGAPRPRPRRAQAPPLRRRRRVNPAVSAAARRPRRRCAR